MCLFRFLPLFDICTNDSRNDVAETLFDRTTQSYVDLSLYLYLMFSFMFVCNVIAFPSFMPQFFGRVDARKVLLCTLKVDLHAGHFTSATSLKPSTPRMSPKYNLFSASQDGQGP